MVLSYLNPVFRTGYEITLHFVLYFGIELSQSCFQNWDMRLLFILVLFNLRSVWSVLSLLCSDCLHLLHSTSSTFQLHSLTDSQLNWTYLTGRPKHRLASWYHYYQNENQIFSKYWAIQRDILQQIFCNITEN